MTTRSLASAMAHRLRESQLPGETAFSEAALADAARFLLEAAACRENGEPAIVVETMAGPLGERQMRVAVIIDDMPFLVDSTTATIGALGLVIERMIHPVISVRRDGGGRLTMLPEGNSGAERREAMVYVETARADARTRVRLRTALKQALNDVRAAVADWPRMQAAMVQDAERLEANERGDEGAALLLWLKEGMLTQLGHVVRRRDGGQAEALGICRKSAGELLSPASYDRAFAWFDQARGAPPLVVKSNRHSLVHRRVPLDLFIVPVLADGQVVGLSVHAAIWTSMALASPPDRVPRLRTRLADLMQQFAFDPAGHDGKALVHVLTALPHDLLISLDEADLERVAVAMMSLVDRPRPKLVLARPPLDRHLFAFAWLPRDAISTDLRHRVTNLLLTGAGAQVLDWSLAVEEGNLALLRFVLDIRNGQSIPDEAALDERLRAMVLGWGHAVESELAVFEEPARAAAIAAHYAEAFPLAYREDSGPVEAAIDIVRLRRLATAVASAAPEAPRRDARLICGEGRPPEELRLKIYQHAGALPLSAAVPILENFGFRVIGETATLLENGRLGAIHDFLLDLPTGLECASLQSRAGLIEPAIADVLNGQADNDAFNHLITGTGLSAREANWLRAWFRYLRQAGLAYGIPTVVEALQNAPRVTLGLIALFCARHDPAVTGDRADRETQALAAVREGLTQVAAINDDRLLRAYRALVEAILRTNAFTPAGKAALAFKLDPSGIPGLPQPVPWREIFVYAARVEGIHLRAGPIARGGLRWSDRRDDFRTEVLGLMKAQRVKNAIIVPTGAKGGFYPKQLPDPARDREGWLAEGKEAYRLFVRGLLSLTDNIVNGKVAHPAGMVVRDGDDPYFVVAADKGTATFSDTANAISAELGFWLDDAFASGGSAGYDHKAMGITARGAWISVQRHFRELGIDVQNESVRVVGCGDMSGDVFGNGMLQSPAIQLVAAFDHRHIFLDPAPDPAASWAERQRLFALPRSSWNDYDRALISPGGGVFPRSLKEIPVSPEVAAVLGMEAAIVDPEMLIAAILRSPVDLLWLGGIGTYVKAAAENNVQVGDPSNDAVRVNGAELRVRVVGEGANLGFTQAGRIEFAGLGGRINTDFIDNSAGVDCSDKEVNIKIALASARRAGRLGERPRLRLLAAMTDDIAALVLDDNRLQALALSIAEAAGCAATPSQVRVIEMLTDLRQLDRKTEGLADNAVLIRRAADGQGLTRPEIAVVMSSAKLAIKDALVNSPVPDDSGLVDELLAAFPARMRDQFRRSILSHRLRREIIATQLANRIVNRLGSVHPFELAEEEAATLSQVAAAFVAAERLFGMGMTWQAIETAEASELARTRLFTHAAAALRPQIADLLRTGVNLAKPSVIVKQLEPGVQELAAAAAELLGSEARAQSERLCAELAHAGAPAAEASRIVRLAELDGAVGLACLARDIHLAAPVLTAVFVEIGARLRLDWAQAAATQMNPSDPWERLLVAGLARDFQQMRLEFLRRITSRQQDPTAAFTSWADSHAQPIRQFRATVERAQGAMIVSPAMLAQLSVQGRRLLAS